MQLIFLLVYFVIKLSNLCGTKNVLISFFVSDFYSLLFPITVVVFTLNFTDVVEHLKCYTNRIRGMAKHEAQGEKKDLTLQTTRQFRQSNPTGGGKTSSRCYSTFADSPLGLDSISIRFTSASLKKKTSV